MLIAGEWVDGDGATEVTSPYSGDTIDTVPRAGLAEVERALAAAVEGARQMARLTAYERSSLLLRAASLLEERIDHIARIISLEEGKPITEARVEAGRCPDLLRLCAFEGAQLRGETLPLDAASNGVGKSGMTIRVPCGVVVAIAPFNFPLLLVTHKVGPALAAGNAVILKPAERTPLSALALVEVLVEAGLPPLAVQCLTGSGSLLGPALVADPRVRLVTFTGSTEVGEQITRIAGVKHLCLELGSNAPLVVLDDADAASVAAAIATSGYSNAGQVCISTQNVLVQRALYGDVLDALVPAVEAIRVGDPLHEDTRLAAMITEAEAVRVEDWLRQAAERGARILTGGERDGSIVSPAVVADVDPEMPISCQELFGPAVAVMPVTDLDEALAIVNGSPYGLGAGIITNHLPSALKFARHAEAGNVHLNGTPTWRADFMPYGGLKGSGVGKEGPRYAVEEMTEAKTIVFH
jgi:acyl-CoA reductase-like NAD-dependent aldehyde dehydrogenase